MADVTATSNDMQQQSSPNPSQITPPAPMLTQVPQTAPPPASQPLAQPVSVPAKPGAFFTNLSHALLGSVLGGLAGGKEQTTSYTTDETGKMTPVKTELTTGDRLRKIARNALLGLAAGSAVPQQKSGGASALAGLGAGGAAITNRNQEQDILKRQQAKEQFEQQQKAQLQKYDIAHQNALTMSVYFGNKKLQNDMTPMFKENEGVINAAKASPELTQNVQEMTDAQVAEARKSDPNFTSTHIIKPMGWAPVTNPDTGEPILNTDGSPQMYMRMGVINATKGGAIQITPEMAQNFHEYGKLAEVANAENIKSGDSYPIEKLLPLMNAVDAERKNVIQGWQKSEIGWQKGPNGEDVPVEINGYDKTRVRLFTTGVTPTTAEAEKGKVELQAAQGAEQRAAAREHLANAAMLMSTIPSNTSFVNDPAVQKQLHDEISQLPPAAQSVLRPYPLTTVNSLVKIANGDATLQQIFPSRNYRLAGGLTAQQALGLVTIINPDWNADLAITKQKDMTDFSTGKEGQAIRSFNQFGVHAAEVKNVSDGFLRSNSPVVNEPLNTIKSKYMGEPQVPELMTAITAARTEWENFIKSGYAPSAEEMNNANILMNDKSTPAQINGVLGVMGTQAIGRLDQINQTWKQAWGNDYPNLITPSGKDAFTKLGLGNQIQQYKTGGGLPGTMNQNNPQTVQPQTPQAPQGATHSGLAADGKTTIFKMSDGTAQDAAGNKYDPNTKQPIAKVQ